MLVRVWQCLFIQFALEVWIPLCVTLCVKYCLHIWQKFEKVCVNVCVCVSFVYLHICFACSSHSFFVLFFCFQWHNISDKDADVYLLSALFVMMKLTTLFGSKMCSILHTEVLFHAPTYSRFHFELYYLFIDLYQRLLRLWWLCMKYYCMLTLFHHHKYLSKCISAYLLGKFSWQVHFQWLQTIVFILLSRNVVFDV